MPELSLKKFTREWGSLERIEIADLGGIGSAREYFTITQELFNVREESDFYHGEIRVASMQRHSDNKLIIQILTTVPVDLDFFLDEENVAIVGGTEVNISQNWAVSGHLYIKSAAVNVSAKLESGNLGVDCRYLCLSESVRITNSTRIESKYIELGSLDRFCQQHFSDSVVIKTDELILHQNTHVVMRGTCSKDGAINSIIGVLNEIKVYEHSELLG